MYAQSKIDKAINTKFLHINIISRNWKELADFYIKVFDCKPLLPERDLSGAWLDRLTGLPEPRISGIHLQLPAYDPGGPTLEIFEYNQNRDNHNKQVNLEGLGHIAFAVDNVEEKLKLVLENGGSALGELVDTEISGIGRITVVYARDPEGNVIEIQKTK